MVIITEHQQKNLITRHFSMVDLKMKIIISGKCIEPEMWQESDKNNTVEKERGAGMSKEHKDVKVYMPNELKGGVYANSMVVSHTQEEFILDFLMVAQPEGTLTARVIVSPGHVKRIFNALAENVKNYEEKFGTIRLAETPKWKTFDVAL
jgi:hypothetical protein